jgi:hypothetical protein
VERVPRGEGEAVPVNRIDPRIVPHESPTPISWPMPNGLTPCHWDSFDGPRTNTDNGGNCPEMSGATVSDRHCARAGCRLLAWMFRRRLPMMHRDEWAGRKANSGMAFAWFAWDRDHRGAAIIDRISWDR